MPDNIWNLIKNNIKLPVLIAFTGILVSFLLCTFLQFGSLFGVLAPLWLTALFCLVCFLLERIPLTRDRKWLKILVLVACVILAGVLLDILV